MKKSQKQKTLSIGGFILVAFALLVAFTSCATNTKIEYRDRDVHHYNTIVQHDTLRENMHDSVYVEIKTRGDTVYNTKYIERTLYKDRIVERHDTCWRDSVVTEYKETMKEVVKYPKMYWCFMGVSIIFLIFAILKLLKWLRIV